MKEETEHFIMLVGTGWLLLLTILMVFVAKGTYKYILLFFHFIEHIIIVRLILKRITNGRT